MQAFLRKVRCDESSIFKKLLSLFPHANQDHRLIIHILLLQFVQQVTSASLAPIR